MRNVLILLLCATALQAAPLDNQSAFDGYTQGKTIYYGYGDERGAVAAETYLPGNRVRWFTRDGTCIEGEWFEADGRICFVYETNPVPQCWEVDLSESGLVATHLSLSGPSKILEMRTARDEFQCLGPQIGV